MKIRFYSFCPILSCLFAFLILDHSAFSQQSPQKLHVHVPSVVASGQAKFVAKLPATRRIDMTIVLPLRDQAELTNLLRKLYDPTSPEYRRFLTVQEFTDQFSPTQQDYEAVIQWAKNQDLIVRREPKNRMVLDVSGTVGQVNTALNVSMNLYHDANGKRDFYSIDREPTLPLTARIAHIEGLNNFSVPRPMIKRTKHAGAVADVTGSGPGGYYLSSDMRSAYYGGTLLTGAGQSVGILEFGGYRLSDVNLTFNNAGQSYNVPINNVLIDGASAEAGSDDSEQVLDIVQTIGMAPGLNQVRVYIGNSGYDADIFNSMATENICKQLSVSWSWSPDDPSIDDGIFQEFAAQGQSIFVASGDDGAYDAMISPYFYPAEDDYVTAVGGTHLTTNYGGGPWVAESAWNNAPSGSGGGISPDGILLPSWQQGVATENNAGSTYLRNVPDVAMEADLDNYYCNLGVCSGGAGGTSFAAPRWAGFMALVNEQATETGNAPTGGLGFINPAIYSIGEGSNYNSDFHDITTGNNDSDNQPAWYSAVTGYDLVTGWGSPSGQGLIDALAGQVVSGFWLSTLPGDVPVAQDSTGSSVVSVTDAGGFSGNVILTASGLPTGVTASFNPSTTTSTSIITLTASNSATVGTSPITITGTSGALSSKASLFVSVNPPSVQPPPIDAFGSMNIGSTSSPSSLTLTFTTAGTLAAIAVLTEGVPNLDFANADGGTCSVGNAYAANASCTVFVSFTPKFAGARYGAVVLEDANGDALAKVYLQGTGVGPQATFNPGTQSTIGSGFIYPEAAASLGDGSVYVTDYGAGNGTSALYLEKFSNGTYTQSKVSCTFTTPAGVAVDSSGTVYVADPGVPAVYKVTVLPNGTCNQSAIGSGFGTPWSVAVDGSGDVYITDLGSSTLAAAVYEETLQANGGYVQSTVGTGWISPAAIAVDSNGNVDVADGGIPGVFMETPSGGSYTQSAIGGGWTAPSGIAVDGSGNVYVADGGNSIVYGGTVPAGIYKEVATGGSYVQTAIGSGWVIPRGIAIDSGGNVYVPDQTRGVFKEDLAHAPVLTFANAPTGTVSSDSPKMETISNLGSMALQFSSLSYPTDFPETTGISTDCTSSASLPAQASCTLSVQFQPTTSLGSNTSLPLNESINLTTNSLNSSTPVGIAVSGTELLPGGSISLGVSPNPAAAGTAVTFTASVSGANGGPVPTGAVTLLNGTTQIAGPLALTNGVATYTTTSLPIGVYAIIASYSGDANYQASNSNTITESIVTAPGVSAFGNTNIGNQNVGTTSSLIPLSITFTVSKTLGNISVLTAGVPNLDFSNAGGGTCTVGTQYAANASCTVNVTFAPKYPGTRFGAVVLADNDGNVIGTGYLEGTGIGPEAVFLPGTLTSPVSGFTYPNGIAVDGSGNLFVADASNATVYKETLANGTYSQSTVGSNFNTPYAVAVDGAGNLYIADAGNHAVYKEAPTNGSYIQTVIGSGFIQPKGVAVDAVGNLYVADSGDGVNPGALYLESLANGGYTQSRIGSGFVTPQGVAVDGFGNIYVADPADGTDSPVVYKLVPANGNYNQTTIGAQWITPNGVAVDGRGNLYVADDAFDLGDGFVLKETPQSDGSYLETSLLGSSSVPYPGGLAVDGSGNLYVTDNLDSLLYRDDIADPPALNFASTIRGTTSSDSPKIVTVQNAGNTTMTFSAVSYPTDFPEAPGTSSDCSSDTSLVVEGTCTLSIDFTPSFVGTNQPTPLNESAIITTDSLNPNGTAQAVAVSGTETTPVANTAVTTPANVAIVGSSVTFTATVTGQSGFPAPTGSISFYSNGTALYTTNLINGAAGYSTSSFSVGTYGITATYSGDQTYPTSSSNILTEQILPPSTFGTQNIGSSSTALTVTITFPARATVGSIAVVTQGTPNLDFTNAGGGTCTVGTAYAANAQCTVKVVFKPRYSGTRLGAVVVSDNHGSLVQTVHLAGTGVGPQVIFPSTTAGIALSYPGVYAPGTGPITVDGSGNVYVYEERSAGANDTLVKWTASGGTYTSQVITTSATGFFIAVDGDGSLYVSTSATSKGKTGCTVLKEALVGGTYKETTAKASTACSSAPNGWATWPIAVDGQGNLFISENDQNRIVKEQPSGSSYTESTVFTETTAANGLLYSPWSIAVDGSGNIYLSDSALDPSTNLYSWRIVQLAPSGGTYTQKVIWSEEDPYGQSFESIYVDKDEDVYFMRQATNPNTSCGDGKEFDKLTPSGTGYTQSAVIPPCVDIWGGAGIDDAGNIYFTQDGSDGSFQVARIDQGDPPILSFASTNVGATSSDSPKAVTVQNSGNAPLVFPVPSSGTNPSISSNFSLSNTTGCPQVVSTGTAGQLAPNAPCVYAVNFTPNQAGTIAGSLVLTDNALNAAGGTQTISLSGTGVAGGGGNKVQIAVLTVGANGTKRLTWVSDGAQLSSALASEAKEWADAYNQTFMVGIAEFETGTCNEIGTGTLSKNSDALNGKWYFPANPGESYELPDGSCPGNLYPFAVARYTWASSQQTVLEDPVVLNWTDPSGQPGGTISFLAQLGHLANDHAVWNVCGDPNSTLPTTATLNLKNPPPNASSYEWTIEAPQNKMTFLNGETKITTTTASTTIKGLDASGARNDITFYVVAKGVPFSDGLKYGPFKTWVRRPNQLQFQKGFERVFASTNDGQTTGIFGKTGYFTSVYLQVDDQFGGNTYNTNQMNVDASEQVSAMQTPSDSSYPLPNNNWQFANGQVNNAWAPPNFSGGQFTDSLYTLEPSGNTGLIPTPQSPPAIGVAFKTQLVTIAYQTIYAGDGIEGPDTGQTPSPYKGCPVQTDTMNYGIDHANEDPIQSPVLAQPIDNLATTTQASNDMSMTRNDRPMKQGGAQIGSLFGTVPDIGFVEKRSPLIVKGRVLAIKTVRFATENNEPPAEIRASIEIKSVIKGELNERNIEIKYLALPAPGGVRMSPNDLVLLFLQRGSDGSFTLVDPFAGSEPIGSSTLSASTNDSPVTEKLEAELVGSLSDPDRRAALNALVQLGNLGHGTYGKRPILKPSSIAALQRVAASGDPESRGLAYIALIKLEEYSALDAAVKFAEQWPQYSTGGTEYADVYEGGGIIGAIHDIGDVKIREGIVLSGDQEEACPSRAGVTFVSSALGVLHSLASSGRVDLRRAAVYALRGICEPSSAAVLARALDSTDSKIQYDALQGLAAIEGFPAERPAPTTQMFNQNQTKYLLVWKNWWEQSGNRKYISNQ